MAVQTIILFSVLRGDLRFTLAMSSLDASPPVKNTQPGQISSSASERERMKVLRDWTKLTVSHRAGIAQMGSQKWKLWISICDVSAVA